MELEPKFSQIIQQDKPNTTAQLLPDYNLTKIWSNYTQDKAYILQHSYSQTSVELGQKFGQIIQQDKPNTTNNCFIPLGEGLLASFCFLARSDELGLFSLSKRVALPVD